MFSRIPQLTLYSGHFSPALTMVVPTSKDYHPITMNCLILTLWNTKYSWNKHRSAKGSNRRQIHYCSTSAKMPPLAIPTFSPHMNALKPPISLQIPDLPPPHSLTLATGRPFSSTILSPILNPPSLPTLPSPSMDVICNAVRRPIDASSCTPDTCREGNEGYSLWLLYLFSHLWLTSNYLNPSNGTIQVMVRHRTSSKLNIR